MSILEADSVQRCFSIDPRTQCQNELQVRGTQASESLHLGPGFLGPVFKILRELLLTT